MRPGPRGTRLYVDSSADLPLVWFQIAVRGGAAGDPIGREGLHRHAILLSRRGAGGRTRRQLDQALDDLGASLDVETSRDSISLSGRCLSRNIDRCAELAADVLARPTMSDGEHGKLLDETRSALDDLRDDDMALAARFFARYCAPGHPYARTAMGNDASLARLGIDEARATRERAVVAENLVVGFAGDVSEPRAEALAEQLVADLPEGPAAEPPAVSGPDPPPGRRLYLIDKPERSQSQVLIGHVAPRYGTDGFCKLMPVETAFGGTFTSRLVREIRVQRGWSYGAGCALGRARGRHWFRIYLAPSAEVTPDALVLAMSLFEEIAADGITADELEFARSYLTGRMPFRLATARRRLQLAVADEVCGLPPGYTAGLPSRLARIAIEDAREAIERWLRPEHAVTVVVTTADAMASRLEGLGLGALEVARYDSY